MTLVIVLVSGLVIGLYIASQINDSVDQNDKLLKNIEEHDKKKDEDSMWLLLNDIRESIRMGEPVRQYYADMIDELETNIPSKFIPKIKETEEVEVDIMFKDKEWYDRFVGYIMEYDSKVYKSAKEFADEEEREISCCGIDITDYDIKMCPKCKEHC